MSFTLTFNLHLVFGQGFNIWGMAVKPPTERDFFKRILNSKTSVTLEEAIFRSELAFKPANLKEHYQFWEEEILKDHPQKNTLLQWLTGVKIEEFLKSFTTAEFQGIQLNSYYPHTQAFSNYVPQEFEQFMDDTVKEWSSLGILQEWDKVRTAKEPAIPTVVSPLGVEPTKPRALWDGRFVNEFCRDIPFSMDNATRVAEVAWENAYFFKLDHKNGYQHVPLHRDSWKFFGVFWKGKYYVFTVLPFGWKNSPLVYHTLTEAVAMYVRSLGIPMLVWIDDMCGMTQIQFKQGTDEQQFQSALKSMVVTTWVLFLAGYFLGIKKCFLIPEQIITYLGIDCDSHNMRFLVPEERKDKYIPLLQQLLTRNSISFAEMERIVGKLASLECAVPAGMWYTRHQYAALTNSGIKPDSSKRVKNTTMIFVTPKIREEWYIWTYFLQENKGSPWINMSNVFVQAEVYSDASGRAFAGVVNMAEGLTKITAGEFNDYMLQQDIQVKEGEALRATISMIVKEMPDMVKGKTLICKIDNQVVKAVLERKGTSHSLALNEIGKSIYWLMDKGQFFLTCEYVQSNLNVSDKFTRESPGLEASLTTTAFRRIWDYFGPFQWDLMATSANVNKDLQGHPLKFFSRYYDEQAKGIDIFKQQLHLLQEMFCFPPLPMISKLLKFLQQQKVSCVLVIPDLWAPWSNLMNQHKLASFSLAEPYNSTCFTVTHASGNRIPKRYNHPMQVVFLSFD